MVLVVAAVAIAVAAPYLAPYLVAGLASIGVTVTVAVATAIVSIGLSLAVSLAFRTLGVGAPSAKSAAGPPQVFRQSIANSFIVYGTRRVGGLLSFFHSTQDVSGAHYRYFVIAAAGHRCQGVQQWMLNDEIVSVDATTHLVVSGKYANNAWLWFQRGLASETANATFVAETGGKWTSAHKGNGVAAIYAKFKLTDDVVEAGMPNITAVIEGRDEIDYHDGATVDYASNAALVFYDWLAMPREEGGFGAFADEIPDDAWILAQANVCAEVVSGESAGRYSIDAVITTGAAPSEIRDLLVVNQGGSCTFSGGKHLMRPGYWVPSSATLSEDDLAGPIQVSPFLAADAAANEVQGTYISPSANYTAAPLAMQTTSPAPDDIKQLDVDLAFVTHKAQGDRILRIMLRRAQCEKTVVWPMNIAGLKHRAMDTVQLGKTEYSLDNYAWTVVSWGLSADFGVVFNLREENEDIYDDPAPVAPVTPPTVSVPDPVRTLAEIQQILQGTYLIGDVDSIDAGSNATIRIHGATVGSNFTLDYPAGSIGDQSITQKSITGKTYGTTYYPFADVDPATLLPTSWDATTVYGDSINSAAHPYRIGFKRSVLTATAGGGTTSGGGTGGSGGGTGSGGNAV